VIEIDVLRGVSWSIARIWHGREADLVVVCKVNGRQDKSSLWISTYSIADYSWLLGMVTTFTTAGLLLMMFSYVCGLVEYADTLRVDEKSDDYNFGVVLLKVITGRRTVGSFGNRVDIVHWVQNVTAKLPNTAAVLAVADRRLRLEPVVADRGPVQGTDGMRMRGGGEHDTAHHARGRPHALPAASPRSDGFSA
jgi:hypothetical protein